MVRHPLALLLGKTKGQLNLHIPIYKSKNINENFSYLLEFMRAYKTRRLFPSRHMALKIPLL